jgi:trans-aconitate 2-methyltransferase
MAWDPDQYRRFRRQRQRPAEDLLAALLAALGDHEPRRIVDLGCGGGFLAIRLAGFWPAAAVSGLDSSAAMLAEAKAANTRVDWQETDIAGWRPSAPPDIIVSNAALHWLGDHQHLFPRLLTGLAPGGVLAVQMPRQFAAPSHVLLAETIRAGQWATLLADRLGPPSVHPPETYIDWLAPHASDLELWETEYLHRLTGDDPVLDWIRGTTLRPILDRLEPADATAFQAAYAARLRAAYPRRPDGTTLFPFRRLFIVARA